jgi:4-hydroxy-tetrahydrodipicolinate reductase
VEAASDLELVAGVSRSDPASYSTVAEALDAVSADVLVDFTHAAVVRVNVLAALERGQRRRRLERSVYSELRRNRRACAQATLGVIAAGNFSLTAALLLRSAMVAARHLEAWEVIDYAKADKPDAPSGTARELAGVSTACAPPRSGSA